MNTRKQNKTVLLLAIMVMTCLGSVANAGNLVAYWPLDEGAGDIAYDAVGDNDGLLVGDQLPTWISPGQLGDGALKFHGSTDSYVNCGTGITADPNMTVAAWIKADGYAYYNPISCTAGGYSGDPGWSVMLRTDTPKGGVWFRVDGLGGDWDGGDLHINEPVFEPGKWVHMAFTFDGGTREINGYVNGELRGTNTISEGRSVANTVDDLKIGTGGESYSGALDEVAIWNVVLTAEDVMNVYNSGALIDPNAPSINLGPDMITLSDLSVDLTASVVNNDTQDPTRPLGFEWTATPGAGVVFEPNEFVLDPTVTITDPAPNNPTSYTLRFAAGLVNPGGPLESIATRNMTINVYSDSCKAKIAADQASMSIYDLGDINLDCITDLKDFAESATKWKKDYSLSAPPEKP